MPARRDPAGPGRRRPGALLGLRARFALTVAAVVVPSGLLTTHLAVEQQVASLERHAEESVRGMLLLLDSGVTNLVAAGDVSGLHDVLGDVRRHEGVVEVSVLDEDGVLLADGTPGEERRFTVPEVHDSLLERVAGGGDGPVFLRDAAHGGADHIDAALPLTLGSRTVGLVVAEYSLAGVRADSATARRTGFAVGLLFTVLAVAAVALLAGRVTRALHRITGAARVAADRHLPAVLAAVREGRVVTDDLLPEPVPADGGGPEARRLGDALNTYRSVVTDMARTLARLLRETDARFASAFDGSPVGMAILDPADGRPVAVNAALARLLGRGPDSLQALPLPDLVHPEDRAAYEARTTALLDGGTPPAPFELRFVRGDGEVVWTTASVALHRDEDGGVQATFVQLVDASARKRAENDLVRMAYHDALTELPNRAHLLDTLERALAHARRTGAPMAALLLDVDHFKVVNDSLGHDAGDVLLREVAARLRRGVREGDTVARFGGDEFVVVAEVECDEDGAALLARRILDALAVPVVVDGRDVHVSASIGIAVSRGETDARGLLRDADTAAYWAKARGRARSELFDDDLRRRADARLETEQELRQALERDELVPYYQPVVSTGTGELLGFEALVRWNHPTRGVLTPAAFLEVALETGLVVAIGRRMLEIACRDLAAWDAAGAGRPWVSVNIDAQQLHLDGFADDVERVLTETGTAPDRLRLELTENAFLDLGSVEATRRLRALGVRLAVDDFGTGYSSLHYLRRLPVDILKIDRSFLEDLSADPQAAAVVRAIVELSHTMALTVVAEGVETPEQLAALDRIGCDASQGYLIARPMPAAAVTGFLDADRVGGDALVGGAV
ncbi:EAL domain-containing protein [Geodermatophilus sp. YIM 151500]|uniref:putative bifunctional diguanylate cyclase/phosphodiesterase n=1 Tax=Geodermatophilus sp. YIM 151500 TaxID=2984531 RepID=UPI0021E3F82A|nr:GGDEF and EAL domain-containing protein [Geodermatophilus sp. YIM 151500]MCV2490195.1 EAL domain-containing protein [Geodermatophilus sp. YIM 151500]